MQKLLSQCMETFIGYVIRDQNQLEGGGGGGWRITWSTKRSNHRDKLYAIQLFDYQLIKYKIHVTINYVLL